MAQTHKTKREGHTHRNRRRRRRGQDTNSIWHTFSSACWSHIGWPKHHVFALLPSLWHFGQPQCHGSTLHQKQYSTHIQKPDEKDEGELCIKFHMLVHTWVSTLSVARAHNKYNKEERRKQDTNKTWARHWPEITYPIEGGSALLPWLENISGRQGRIHASNRQDEDAAEIWAVLHIVLGRRLGPFRGLDRRRKRRWRCSGDRGSLISWPFLWPSLQTTSVRDLVFVIALFDERILSMRVIVFVIAVWWTDHISESPCFSQLLSLMRVLQRMQRRRSRRLILCCGCVCVTSFMAMLPSAVDSLQ